MICSFCRRLFQYHRSKSKHEPFACTANLAGSIEMLRFWLMTSFSWTEPVPVCGRRV